MPIIAGGIGSGLDINGLVSQLVAAEAEPLNSRYNRQEIEYGSELSAFGTLKSALSTFESSVEKIADSSTFQVYKANSSNDEIYTATADGTAVAGSYSIEVVQIAQPEKLKSIDFTSATEEIGTGTLDISLGAESFQLTIDSSNSSLEAIRDLINGAENNPGISASIIKVDSGTQLILSSNQLGSSNTIDVVAVDGDALDGFDLTRLNTANLISLQTATDAIIKLDNQTVTHDSNDFSDVITGVSFSLKKAQVGTVETLTIVADEKTIKQDIESFVSSYNVLTGVMRGLSSFNPTTAIAGPLNGDSVMRTLQSSLRQTLSLTVAGGAFSNLSDLGISIGSTGSLEIDDTILDANISSNLSNVEQFFSSSTGLAQTFTTSISAYVTDDGIIESRTEGLQNRLDGLDDKRDALNRRMDSFEARLTAQFTAMDILVAQLQATGSFLQQQLDNLPGVNSLSRR